MSYVLGYIVADGCVSMNEDRKQPYTVNITSIDRPNLVQLKKAFQSEHKISEKRNGAGALSYQIQFRNYQLATDLIRLGVTPRKTYSLEPIYVPDAYFADFFRGFFDGDGTVYIYQVNGVPQIKAGVVCTSLSFITDLNQRLCRFLNIPEKSIHRDIAKRKMTKYSIIFYIDDCKKLARFMYQNNPKLFLPRKRIIFQKWTSTSRRPYKKRSYPSKIGWHLNQNLNQAVI